MIKFIILRAIEFKKLFIKLPESDTIDKKNTVDITAPSPK